MTEAAKYRLNKILAAIVWVLLGSGTIILLVAAITKKNNEHCLKSVINISGVENNFFIDKKDVLNILEKINGGKLENKPVHNFDLASMEIALQKDKWIRKAELFFDNNNVLQVRIAEREPISRIFTTSGSSFYMDSTLKRLPLSDKFSARLPVFTNFPTDLKVLTKKDSNLLRQIKKISEYIESDPFWMAQIEQVDITPAGTFTLIPKLGNQVIDFGSAVDYREKFRNLLAFYKQVESNAGWNMYSIIDVKFKGQVIGVKRGAEEMKLDSLKAIQIMKNIIANAQKHSNDSSAIQLVQPAEDNSTINTTPRVDEAPDESANKGNVSLTEIQKSTKENTGEIHDSALSIKQLPFKKQDKAPLKKQNKKPLQEKKKDKAREKPKAVMPSTNDY